MASRESIEVWDREAATFDEAADHGLRDPDVRRAWGDLLADLVPGPGRVADLGCGTGALSLLLADQGHRVDGVDFSPAMIELARAKAGDRADVGFRVEDAAAVSLAPGSYDTVLCRHVLWAMPDPLAALRHWTGLLTHGGRLVLVEGCWSTGAGLTAERTVALVEAAGRRAELRRLPDAAYWGGEIADERYAVVSPG